MFQPRSAAGISCSRLKRPRRDNRARPWVPDVRWRAPRRGRGAFKRLPGCDRDEVNIEMSRQRRDREITLDGSKRHLRRERR
jgi:hypothetical protein